MIEIVVAVVIFVLGVVVDRFVANSPRITDRPSLDVVVESDPAVFLAGQEPWDGFEYVFPEKGIEDVGDPPTSQCREWFRWASGRAGVTANEQRIQVILVPRGSETILVEALVVKIERFDAPLDGIHVGCAVGGADGEVRHIRVELLDPDNAFTSYHAGGEGETVSQFKFTIGPGDAERFEIHALADAYVEWCAELHLIANGRRIVTKIDDDGRPFRVTGSGRAASYWWYGEAWEPVAGGSEAGS